MYNGYFGFSEAPFTIAPDTSFFYGCPSSQEALNTLLIAATTGEGFIKITGEVGTGKTMLCRKFVATLDSTFVAPCILNPRIAPRALVMAIAEQLKAPLHPGMDQYHLEMALIQRLMYFARAGKRVVLCIDEAQGMPNETLEALRLLTNIETEKRKLLQIVLFGQPELDEKLRQPSIRQLAQRITFDYCLRPLRINELDAYLRHRLDIAGYRGEALFGRGAVRAMHWASRGIPRVANILANKALMLVYGEGGKQVAARHVRAAAKDTISARKNVWLKWEIAGLAILVAGASVALAYLK